jgi:hypothetical protein
MVAAALERARQAGRTSGGGGISFVGMPGPDDLGPLGAYLVDPLFGWCSGEVVFAGGSEVAIVERPRLLEVVRTQGAASLQRVLEAFVPRALSRAEANQVSDGGGNPRFGPIFSEPAPDLVATPEVRSCVLVSDRPELAAAMQAALESRSIKCHRADLVSGFSAAANALASVVEAIGPVDAVVVAPAGSVSPSQAEGWQQILEDHRGIVQQIFTDAGWARAVADYSARAERPVQLVALTDAVDTGGRSRAQASAQLARAAAGATGGNVTAFAVSVEEVEAAAASATGELVAYLIAEPDSKALAGAELAVGSGWLGLRGHPRPLVSVTFGGPEIPDWLDGALRQVIRST